MRRGATSELWKHIRAYRKESSHGDEKAPRRRDAESDSPIINNKSSVISGGIISPGTARNKTGERVSVFFLFFFSLKGVFPRLTFKNRLLPSTPPQQFTRLSQQFQPN